MDVWFCAGRDHAERHVMRAEMVDTGARSPERAGEKCVFYLTETGSKIAFLMPDSLEVRLGSQEV